MDLSPEERIEKGQQIEHMLKSPGWRWFDKSVLQTIEREAYESFLNNEKADENTRARGQVVKEIKEALKEAVEDVKTAAEDVKSDAREQEIVEQEAALEKRNAAEIARLTR